MLFVITVLAASAAAPNAKEISLADLRDRIEGGWAGQMIGVSYGAPTEFRYRNAVIPENKIPGWRPERVSNSLEQDDLYVDMTFAQVLDDKGLDASSADFGAAFKNSKYRLWHANLAARRALKRGVPAELSGTPKYNVHANDIDFQIEADFIGMMTPGLPQAANDIALRAGRVMNYGDGIYGGMFVSCMYAAAFFESNPRKVVEAGIACLPARSPYALMMNDVLAWSKQSPDDWIGVWNRIEEKWNKREPCPEGAMRPFNIDAKINGAYIALGLIYGAGDIGKTVNISTRCGQDSDCNPSSAAGIVGVMLGYKRIPNEWKSGIPAIADKKFEYTDYSFRTIVASTEKRALAMIKRTGGRVEGDKVSVRMQAPKPAALALWDDYGSPAERVEVDSPRWTFKGSWETAAQQGRNAGATRKSSKKNAEAMIEFEGTGAILCGPYLPNGGKADVYLDGKLDRTVDVYPDEDQPKGGEAVWHAFGLKNGKHTVRLVVRGETYPGSSGAEIALNNIVTFR
jgi:hypothetical protein